MPADVYLTSHTGIVIAIVALISLVIVCRKVLCREAKFNYRLEMLSSIDKTFKWLPDKLKANDCQIPYISFKDVDNSIFHQEIAIGKGKFRL